MLGIKGHVMKYLRFMYLLALIALLGSEELAITIPDDCDLNIYVGIDSTNSYAIIIEENNCYLLTTPGYKKIPLVIEDGGKALRNQCFKALKSLGPSNKVIGGKDFRSISVVFGKSERSITLSCGSLNQKFPPEITGIIEEMKRITKGTEVNK
jgi:hypothetical protein